MPALLDLLLPRHCPCGALPEGGDPLCADCLIALTHVGAAQLACAHASRQGLPVCAMGAEYTGRVRRTVIAYKERGRRDLAASLSLAVEAALRILPIVRAALTRPGAAVLLVPVPASRAGWRARGVDHVAAIAAHVVRSLRARPEVCAQIGWKPLLIPSRRVADQAGLSAAARASNVAESLRVRPGVAAGAARGSPVLVLLDDVLTSGATLAEAARALRAAGLQPRAGAVVAGVPRSGQSQGNALLLEEPTD